MKKISDIHIFIFIILLFVGLLADIADFTAYLFFFKAEGTGFFSGVTLKKYMTTFPGNILTILGFLPALSA
ncbi:MAG: hypothetical protein GY749_40475 [Desulfobacteraceae bacterium]|nr:hypothetical protein [Desulfobacteraceae bacterium]